MRYSRIRARNRLILGTPLFVKDISNDAFRPWIVHCSTLLELNHPGARRGHQPEGSSCLRRSAILRFIVRGLTPSAFAIILSDPPSRNSRSSFRQSTVLMPEPRGLPPSFPFIGEVRVRPSLGFCRSGVVSNPVSVRFVLPIASIGHLFKLGLCHLIYDSQVLISTASRSMPRPGKRNRKLQDASNSVGQERVPCRMSARCQRLPVAPRGPSHAAVGLFW
jgi:hypothetical protein